MNHDEYGEIVNGEKTYKEIAEELKGGNNMLIGWTDQNSTHLDILFSHPAVPYGTNIQGGVRGTDLFVSIMRWGAFGFEIEHKDTHPGYYNEKLGNRGSFGTECSEKLAELINGVKKYL